MIPPITELFSGEAGQRVGWALVHFLWQGAAVALLLAALLRALRQRSAQARWLAACAALGLMVLAPAMTAMVVTVTPDESSAPAIRAAAPALPAAAVATEQNTGGQVVGGTRVFLSETPAVTLEASPAPWHRQASVWIHRALPWLLAAWLAGVAALALWHVGGWLQVERAKRRGTRAAGGTGLDVFQRLVARLRVSRPVRLLESAQVSVPMVVGWLRPVVLMPARMATGLAPAQLEAILAHELAHIRRYDGLVRLIQAAAETLLFYHPAVWWVSRRITEESELCCDELAVAVCGDRQGYAAALARVAELSCGRPRMAAAATGGSLVNRIRRILRLPEADHGVRPGWLAGMLLLAVVVAGGAIVVGCMGGREGSHPAMGGDPELLRLVAKAIQDNNARISTWQGKATTKQEIMDAEGIVSVLAKDAAFLYDKPNDRMRWNWKITEHQVRENGAMTAPPNEPKTDAGMFAGKEYYLLSPTGHKMGTSVWVDELAVLYRDRDNGVHETRSFDPRRYNSYQGQDMAKMLMTRYVDSSRPPWPDESITRLGDRVLYRTRTNDDALWEYTFDLSKGGQVVNVVRAGRLQSDAYTYEYEKIDGVWLPRASHRESAPVMSDSKRKIVEDVRFTENTVNRTTPDSAFTLAALGVKEGCLVSDCRGPARSYHFTGKLPDAPPEADPLSLADLPGLPVRSYNTGTFIDFPMPPLVTPISVQDAAATASAVPPSPMPKAKAPAASPKSTPTPVGDGPVRAVAKETPSQKDLRRKIEDHVRTSEPWESAGGRAALRFQQHGFKVLIRQTPEGHEQLAALIEKWRGHPTMITVPCRFITLSVEDSQAMGQWMTRELKVPRHAEGSQLEAGYVLNEAKTKAFLDEIKKQKSVEVLTAPQLTLFGGQQSYISVGAKYTPLMRRVDKPDWPEEYVNLHTGTTLCVRATLTPDQRSIDLFTHLKSLLPAKETELPTERATCLMLMGDSATTVHIPEGESILTPVPLEQYRLLGFAKSPEEARDESPYQLSFKPDGSREHAKVLWLLVQPKLMTSAPAPAATATAAKTVPPETHAAPAETHAAPPETHAAPTETHAAPPAAAKDIRGRVLDHQGKPVSGATVRLAVQELAVSTNDTSTFDGTDDVPHAVTDAEGRFVLAAPTPAGGHLVVSAPTMHAWPAPLAPAGQENLIRLPQPGTLTVRYNVTGGPDTAEFILRLHTQETPEWKGWFNSMHIFHVRNGDEVVLRDVAPGRYSLVRQKGVSSPLGTSLSIPIELRDLALAAGESQTAEVVRKDGQRLQGRVTGLGPLALPGAYVRVIQATSARHLYQYELIPTFDMIGVGPDGVFQTEPLPPGHYTLVAEEFSTAAAIQLKEQYHFVGLTNVTVPTAGQEPISIAIKPDSEYNDPKSPQPPAERLRQVIELQIQLLVRSLDDRQGVRTQRTARKTLLAIGAAAVPALTEAARGDTSTARQAREILGLINSGAATETAPDEAFAAKLEQAIGLSTASHETAAAKLPDLFEKDRDDPTTFCIREGTIVARPPKECLLFGDFYYVPEKDIFYVHHKNFETGMVPFYGPFKGKPWDVLAALGVKRVPTGPWGLATEGVLTRIRTEKTPWKAGETPTVTADVRNQGKRDLRVMQTSQGPAELEIDGVWFQPTVRRLIEGSDFGPGKEYDDLLFTLDDASWAKDGKPGLKLAPGKHKVRVALIAQPAKAGEATVRTVSNMIEIEILPAADAH
jgi:beta-lactamase regulating signal transducer with metallopeptidase domain